MQRLILMNKKENPFAFILKKILCTFIVILVFTKTGHSQLTVLRLFEEADSFMKKGLYNDAIKKYDSVLFYQTNNAMLFYNLALAHINLQNYGKALVHLNKCLTIDTSLIDAYFNRAFVNQILRNDAFAIGDYNIYLTQYPNDAEALLARGKLHLAQKEPLLAINDISAYTKQIKTNDEAYLALFFCYKMSDQQEKAIIYIDSAINIRPFQYKYYELKGNLLFDMRKFPDACQSYDKLLKYQPHNTAILDAKAEAKFQIGLINDAVEAMEKALDYEPMNKGFMYDKAFYLLQAKRYPEALEAINKLIDLKYKDSANSFFIRAVINNNLGYAEAACADFEKSGQLGNTEAPAYAAKLCNDNN